MPKELLISATGEGLYPVGDYFDAVDAILGATNMHVFNIIMYNIQMYTLQYQKSIHLNALDSLCTHLMQQS